jgi:hypothetical protein
MSKTIGAPVVFVLLSVTVYWMFVGEAASAPCVVTDRAAVAPDSVMFALAVAPGPGIETDARLGALIVAVTVSVPSNRASFRTVTVSVPVVEPSATLTAAAPAKAV